MRAHRLSTGASRYENCAMPNVRPARCFGFVRSDRPNLPVETGEAEMGPVRLVKSGIEMRETPPQMRLPPPMLGENTSAILESLGYDENAIAGFRASGVI